MPVLDSTDHVGTVVELLVNADGETLESAPRERVDVDWGGFVGEVHGGLTRPACSRVRRQYPRGTEIRNVRQLSALAAEDIEAISAGLGLERLEPGWLGANLVVAGLPDFTHLPPSSRLIAANGTSLVVDMENAPCRFPGEIIERHRPGHGAAFPTVALGRRGVTLWVERPGALAVGDALALHVPPPERWAGRRDPARGPGPSSV